MSYTPPPSSPAKRPSTPGTPQKQDPTPQENHWAFRIATVSGIPIRLHFTFLLVMIWFAINDLSIATARVPGAVPGMGSAGLVVSMLGLFLCVALHELGHSLVAQKYGYPVRDITLYPIGGVAAIEGSPRPRHELYIALAGPAVNVVIALLLSLLVVILGRVPVVPPDGDPQAWQNALLNLLTHDALGFLLGANIGLVLFNMIPAFPMDGGRVLRAVLGLKLGKPRATRIAANIGQFVAVLMALWGLGVFGGGTYFGLVIIALFVFFGAAQERDMEVTQEIASDAPVSAAMVREFSTLTVGDTLRRAAEVLLATHQQDFPVQHGDEVVGVLSRSRLLRALAEQGDGAYVAGAMERSVVFARPSEPLEEYLLRPDGVQRSPVLVQDEAGHLIGMLTVENVMEFLTLRQITQAREEVTT